MTVHKNLKGFTLIELLIVMAILGVLAVVVLVAINPVQQLARTRDSGRKSTITQLGHAMEAYYTSHGGAYVAEGATWIDTLATAGEMASAPSAIAYTVTGTAECALAASRQNGYCYDATDAAGAEPVLIYATMESDSEISKCAAGDPYFVWSTEDGRGGLVCGVAAPTPGTQTWNPVQ
ncbi:type II secretion system protein [Patescibacteria group bacterium]